MTLRSIIVGAATMGCGEAVEDDLQLEGLFAVSATTLTYSCGNSNPVPDTDLWVIEHQPDLPTMGTARVYFVQGSSFRGSFHAGATAPAVIAGRLMTARPDVLVETQIESWSSERIAGAFRISEGNCVPAEGSACLAIKTQPDCGEMSFVAMRQ